MHVQEVAEGTAKVGAITHVMLHVHPTVMVLVRQCALGQHLKCTIRTLNHRRK